MADNLVIVESPAKAKTIKKYLGRDFDVLASYGHVRDLVPKEGAVDPDNGFAMKYQVLEKNERHVEAIARSLRKAKALYLATDPDREGEAIAWHLKEILQGRGDLDGKEVHRVVFYEITRNAIRAAVGQPRGLSLELVNAQQARRALDYLVGFNLSPLLWKKVRRGLSAGRVQSPALRMICEREDEIAAFVAREYWSIDAELEHSEQKFPGKLVEFHGTKVEQFSFTNEASARDVERALQTEAKGELTVLSVDRKQRKRNPAPPFTTSTLQQEAARKLGFSAQKTMRVAQQLYEGVDIGEGQVGLITYMRTDSLNLAQEAIGQIRDVIVQLYGQAGLAEEPRIFKTKSKNAQEAHEAIRPTAVSVLPGDIENKLESDQFRLYSLIWKRTVACQMAPAIFDTVTVEMRAGPEGPKRTVLRANGSTLVKPGYISVYQEGLGDAVQDDSDHVLPPMKEGDRVKLVGIVPSQHFTEPPPRFSEASLVKALEEYGIGRPSTYASIISTLRDRQYVDIESRRFTATDIGKIVSRFLTQYFTTYVDYDFTAKMEDSLDAVASGLARAGNEGYLIRSLGYEGHRVTVIAANTDIGVLYGTFHFLRLLQTHQSLEHLDLTSTPRIRHRVLDHWDNLDRTVERGYAGESIWDWHKLPDYRDPRYTDYARACASLGINGTVPTNVNASPVGLTHLYLQKYAALADVLRPYGLRIYLTARFSAPIESGGLKSADPLDPAVRAWWRAKADEIYTLIPDFGGFLVKANSEGQPGPQDYSRTHADGANMLAEAVAPHGGIIMWRAFVYSQNQPDDRAKQAYAEFVPLDGKFRDNVVLQVKNGPIDFQPREPFHPLFGAMPRTPLTLEVQITKEYLGFATHLVYLGAVRSKVERLPRGQKLKIEQDGATIYVWLDLKK